MDYAKWANREIDRIAEPRARTETVVALAEMLEITKSTMYVYLRGEQPFSTQQVDTMAKFFGVESPSRSKNQKVADQSQPVAIYSGLPSFTGDCYGYGGGAVITIGQKSIILGEGREAHELAREIARRWNAYRAAGDSPPAGTEG